MKELQDHFVQALDAASQWQAHWPAYARHPSLFVGADRLAAAWQQYLEKMQQGTPYFHPSYAGQMQQPPHPVAALGYFTAMLANPNNYCAEGGAATLEMEQDVVRQLAEMLHLPVTACGHLTSSGTLANLEALWVSRELRPGQAVVMTDQAHTSHRRLAALLGLPVRQVSTDAAGRLDLVALEAELRRGQVGTVVLTAGTTGVGAVDPIDEVLKLRDRYDFRIHVDASYGGFFTLLAWADDPLVPITPLKAIAQCDSVAIDPHKHGLQPYGCGCILFADDAGRRIMQHESPYTCLSEELSGGEQQGVECSRAGAAAGALWMTLKCLPLAAETGMGPVLRACLRAARQLAASIDRSETFCLYIKPVLDIVTFLPRRTYLASSLLDQACAQLAQQAAAGEAPLFFSLLRISSARLRLRQPHLQADQPDCRILRAVLMKPEHEAAVAGWLPVLTRLTELRAAS
jgi:glutamate/tyrosine decarboxylase-like PLP-dependent enzyme